MIAADRSKVDPALLPPSPRAVFYHGFRLYHQIQIWKQLSGVEKDPLRWGWVIENKMYTPIMTDTEAVPPTQSDTLRLYRTMCK